MSASSAPTCSSGATGAGLTTSSRTASTPGCRRPRARR
jgi:hypothetical protein